MISFESSVEIARPVSEVFSFVADPANEPSWHTDVVTARLEPGGEPGQGRILQATFNAFGRKADAVADVIAFEPDQRIVYRFRGATYGLTPTLTYSFGPAGAGTRFTRRVDVRPGGLMRLLAPLMRGQMARRNGAFVENLRRRLESKS